MYKNFTAVNILTKYRADVNLPNMNGHTPLSFAVFNNDKKSIDILLKNNNLYVDAESANFIILKNIQKYFKDIEIPVDTKKNIIDIVKTTTKQLRESNPSINFYSIVQGKCYEKFFNAMLGAAADNQKQELIDLSKNIISKAELHKDITTVRNNIKEHINEHPSYNNITTKTNNQTKNKGVSLGK
ncbi:MAG: ankyrin repeat domain-containing protein [Rickettsia endosymbiont of Bryobia graminum]|nr:ankyrin repeat domain-containing protein [Rickettsia endosymbiont of Bryobia graminum]